MQVPLREHFFEAYFGLLLLAIFLKQPENPRVRSFCGSAEICRQAQLIKKEGAQIMTKWWSKSSLQAGKFFFGRNRYKWSSIEPKRKIRTPFHNIATLTDVGNIYLFNACLYAGKDTNGIGLSDKNKKLSKPSQSNLRLSEPIMGSHRNHSG